MAVSVGEIEATLVLRDQMTGALNTAVAGIEKAGAKVSALSGTLGLIGGALTVGVTLPLINLAKEATSMAATYETSLTKIETQTGASRAQVAEWSKEILALGPSLAKGPQELAEGMLAITSAGYTGAKAIDVLSDAAKASAIGLGDVKTIGRAVTSVLQAYGDTNISSAQATATLIGTIKEGNIEASSLAGVIGRVVGIAAQMGISFQEVGGFVASFSRVGVKADEAVTALRGFFNVILKDSPQTSKALASVGTSVDELRKNIKEKGLAQALVDLVRLFKGNEDALAHVIPNIRALAGVLSTAGSQGEKFVQIQSNINDMFANARETIDERFARVLETIGGKWDRLRASMDTVVTTIGTNLLPLVGKILDVLNALGDAAVKVAAGFNKLPEPLKQVGVALGVIAAATGPALVATWAYHSAIGALGKLLPSVFGGGISGLISTWGKTLIGFLAPLGSTILPTVTVLLKGIAAAFAALTSPIGLTVAALAAVAAAVIYFSGAWDAIVAGFWAGIQAAKDLWTVLSFLAKGIGSDVVAAFKALWTWSVEKLSGAWESLQSQLGQLGDGFKQLGRVIMSDLTGAWAQFVEWVDRHTPDAVKTLLAALIELGARAKQNVGTAVSSLHDYAEAVRSAGDVSAQASLGVRKFWDEIKAGGGGPQPPMSIDDAFKELEKGLATDTIKSGMASIRRETELASQKLRDLPSGAAKELAAAIKSGAFSAKELAAAFGLNEAAIEIFKTRLEKSTAALDQFNTAARNIEGLVQPYEELSGTVAEAIKYFLVLGASQADLATYFGVSKGAVEALADELGEIPAKIAKMDRAITVALAHGASAEQLRLRFGSELTRMVSDAKLFGLQMTKAIENAFLAVTFDQFALDQRKLFDDIARSMEASTKKALDSTNTLYIQGLANQVDAQKQAATIRAKMSMGAFEYQKFLILQEEAERIASVQRTVANYEEQIAAIKDLTAARMGEASKEWQKQLDEMNAATNSWGNLAREWLSEFPNLLKQAFTGGGGLAGGLKGLLSGIGGDIGSKLFSNLAAKMNNGLVGLFGTKFTEVLGGIIPGIGGAIGALAGPLIEKFVGLFRKPEWKKLQKDIGRDFGINISDGLAQQLEADSKKFGRQAAGLLHLKEIFDEAGGITTSNFVEAAAKIHDVFSLIETDQLTIAQGAKIIDENWQALLKAGTDSFGFIDDKLKEIIKLDRELGTNSQEVTKFLEAQAKSVVDGFGKVASAFKDQFDDWATLKKSIDEAKKAGQPFNELLDKQTRLAKENADRLNDLGVIAVGAFGAAIKSGMSFAQALTAVGPQFASIKTAMDNLGVSSNNAFFNMLALQSQVIANNPALIEGIAGLGDALVGMANLGMLNAETFAAMQRTGAELYRTLQSEVAKVGGATKDALLPMQDFLHRAAQAAEELGIPLDETIALLIEQSKELGIWKDKAKDANTQMLEGLDKIVEKLDELISRLTGIPKIVTTKIVTEYEDNGPTKGTNTGEARDGSGSGNGLVETPDGNGGLGDIRTVGLVQAPPGSSGMGDWVDHARFANGGAVEPAPVFGTDSVSALLTPGEVVLNAAQQRNLADQLGGSQGSVTVHVDARGSYFDEVAVDQLAKRLQKALWRQVAGNVGSAYTNARAALNLTS